MSQIQESEGGNSVSRGPSFPLAAMFVISLVASVMAAAGFYLARSIETGRQKQFAFIIFTLTAPTLLIVVVGSLVRLVRCISRRIDP